MDVLHDAGAIHAGEGGLVAAAKPLRGYDGDNEMNVRDLKQLLTIFPDDMDIYVTTSPSDLCGPLQMKNISIFMLPHDDKAGRCLAPTVLFTAYVPGESR